MLKLVRNTLAEKEIILDKDGGKILWQQQMKVNLAAQPLRSSVADAIEYCETILKLPQFQGSEAMVKFLRMFDHLFDVLNSRNPLAKGY